MRVISMVPSWTETLLRCGIEVIGRTRFCIHPGASVAGIPAVGGTKDIRWEKARDLGADLLLLDKEENPSWMAEQASLPWLATHVRSVNDVGPELRRIAAALGAKAAPEALQKLDEVARRWERQASVAESARTWSELPGVLEWLRPVPAAADRTMPFLYLIWRGPWMVAGPSTFIGSMLKTLGYGERHIASEKTYPQVDLGSLDPGGTLLLFSSEPFPFHKKRDEIAALGFPSAVVDGESFSWFGLRSLEFLESVRG